MKNMNKMHRGYVWFQHFLFDFILTDNIVFKKFYRFFSWPQAIGAKYSIPTIHDFALGSLIMKRLAWAWPTERDVCLIVSSYSELFIKRYQHLTHL